MKHKFCHNILALYRRVVNKLFQIIGVTVYFENKYGVKSYNKIHFVLPKDKDYSKKYISPTKIFMSFDGLKDEYSYIDTPLVDSPHVDMIRRIHEQENIEDCQYLRDELKGKLDGRYELTAGKKIIQQHINAAHSASNNKCPIVYKLDDRYYVIDGKHRLSTALTHNVDEVCCIEIPVALIAKHAYTRGIYKKMLKCSGRYKKNLTHLQKIIDTIEL